MVSFRAALALVACALAIASLMQPSRAEILQGCGEITKPGYYYISNDIQAQPLADVSYWGSWLCCIDILSDGVVLDGGGHTMAGIPVDGDNPPDLRIGVCSFMPIDNFTLKDVTLKGFFSAGLRFISTARPGSSPYSNITLNNVTAQKNDAGILISPWTGLDGLVIKNSDASFNNIGIMVEGGGVPFRNITIEGSSAYSNNGASGITLKGSGISVINSIASYNANGYGFSLYPTGGMLAFSRNIASKNKFGLYFDPHSTNDALVALSGNSICSNSKYDIYCKSSPVSVSRNARTVGANTFNTNAGCNWADYKKRDCQKALKA